MPKKILITKKSKKFLVKDNSKDFHSQYGLVKSKDLKKKDGSKIKTNTGKELTIFSPYFIDLYLRIKRDAQIIPLKDIGLIITETGIGKNSKVLDAGSGSGALALFLSHICKSVISYEIRKDFIKIVKENIEMLGLKNIKIKNKDIYKGISDKGFDVIILDVPSPWKAIDNAAKGLKPGGFLVSYSPTIPQVMDFVKCVNKSKEFVYLKTSEIIEREWEVEERKVRPKSKGIGHSGFLSFVRRI